MIFPLDHMLEPFMLNLLCILGFVDLDMEWLQDLQQLVEILFGLVPGQGCVDAG